MVGLDSDAALTHATSLGDREGELGIPIEEAKAAMERQDQGAQDNSTNPQQLPADSTQGKSINKSRIIELIRRKDYNSSDEILLALIGPIHFDAIIVNSITIFCQGVVNPAKCASFAPVGDITRDS